MSERAANRVTPQKIFRPNHAVMSGMDQGLRLREWYATPRTRDFRLQVGSGSLGASYNVPLAAPPLPSSASHVRKHVNFPTPKEIFHPSTGKQLRGDPPSRSDSDCK